MIKSLVRIAALSLPLLLSGPLAMASIPPTPQQLSAELKTLLSGRDIISLVAPARWSTFGAPQPAVVINPQNELDVAIVVRSLPQHDYNADTNQYNNRLACYQP